MYISYKWLSELVRTELDPYELADKLTLIGLEIDGMHDHGEDVIFDIEVTSNRGDCLSHFGVAREVSAYSGNPVDLPGKLDETPKQTGRVEIADPEFCQRFTARVINGVKVGPSPEWLVQKLESVGERSINNIADVTNLVMHELGQPMHAFDLDRLAESRIVVRLAKKGEVITTLDEIERKLNESMLAICDAERPVAVAGVMGGFESSITSRSTNVLLEVAYFKASSIRETSNRLTLTTEASYRFERGVDIENLVRASNRAAELICELAGGELGEFCDVYPVPSDAVSIAAPDLPSEVARLIGISLPAERIDGILAGLGVRKGNDGLYWVPTWRHDLSITEDLVEEVIRVHGYDQIGEALSPASGAGEYHETEPRKRRLRRTLSALGFDESISYSFVDADRSARFFDLENGCAAPVNIKDPIIEGADLMRTTLTTGLVDAVRTNFNHKAVDLKLFEIGKVFCAAENGNEDGLPSEREILGIVITGRERFEGSSADGREFDYFDLKAAVEQSADAFGVPALRFVASESIPFYQNGQSAIIECDGVTVGRAGKLAGPLASSYKFKQPVFVAELDLSTLLDQPDAVPVYTPLPLYPSIRRDVSLVVSNDIGYGEIAELIEKGGHEFFERVSYVDTYSGSGIRDDERAVTIRLEYRSDERTLTDEEVDAVHGEVLGILKKKLDARFR